MKSLECDPAVACYIAGSLYDESPHYLWKTNFNKLSEYYNADSVVLKFPKITLSVIFNKCLF